MISFNRLKYWVFSSIIVPDTRNKNRKNPVWPINNDIPNAIAIAYNKNLRDNKEYILTITELLNPNALNVPDSVLSCLYALLAIRQEKYNANYAEDNKESGDENVSFETKL